MADELERLREGINQHLRRADLEGAGIAIAKAVPYLLEISVDEWVDDSAEAPGDARKGAAEPTLAPADAAMPSDSNKPGSAKKLSSDSESGESLNDSDDDSDDDDADASTVTSYRYRSMLRHPRNPRLEHLCTWLYDTVVHPESDEEPEEQACQKLPAAILAAWRRLQQLQQQQRPPQEVQQLMQLQLQQEEEEQDAPPGSRTTAGAVPLTEALHLQHSAFSAPFCTWRPVAPDALPPLHDVLVGVLRVCWERHDDREPSRNIIWGAQSHSRRDDPVTAYLYVEYLRLMLVSIARSCAEPLWLWHELQEIIEEYPHWRHHPHEVAVLARMMAEHGCGWRLLNSLLDHIGKAPLLMYGTWAALWDGLRRSEARACARLAAQYGMSLDVVWVHVAELTLLQVKEHPLDTKLLTRAVAVLGKVLALTPAPAQLAALLRAERDAQASCEGMRHVTSQLPLDGYLAAASPA